MGLKVFFESECFVIVGKSAVPDKLPGFVLGCVCGLPGVMFRQTSFQICRSADVFLIGEFDAADDVDVPHGGIG